MQTLNAKNRRLQEGFFEKYLKGSGIDICTSDDPVTSDCRTWDIAWGDPDATFMEGIDDEAFDWVYSSHGLEHLSDPETGLKNWFRILKPRGFLILYVPDRELCGKSKLLPDPQSKDHTFYFTIDKDEAPCTFGIVQMIQRTLGAKNYRTIYVKECASGNNSAFGNVFDLYGEHSIECVIQKL